jgi:[acyl-carrier-protein] S-malonyltransferase
VTTGGGSAVAAWVDGEAVPVTEVEAEVARLRAGPLAERLPPEGTAGGRQLRRWVTQRVVLHRLLDNEARARGLTSARDPVRPGRDELADRGPVRSGADAADRGPVRSGGPATGRGPAAGWPGRADPALLGAAAADVLATSAPARAVLATFAVQPSEADVRAHYDAHPDRYARPERWLARQAFAPTEDALVLGPPTEVDPATLLPELRARPAGAVHSGLGWHRLVVDAVLPAGPVPYAEVRPAIAAELAGRTAQLAFARWLDAAAAARIRLAPGFEHPADPRQPDATHRH